MTEERRADLLRAFKVLEPDPEDDEVRDAMAALFGLQWVPGVVQPKTVAPSPPPVAPTPLLDDRPETTVPARPTPVAPSGAEPEPFRLTRRQEAERRLPLWVDEAVPLPRLDEGVAARPIAVEPLLDPRQARAVLSGILARHTADGPLDVARVVERVARGDAIRDVPRQPLPSLARGVQLLMDRGDAMAPYAADQAWLLEMMPRVVGRHALEVLQFAESPLRGAGKGSRRKWTPYTRRTPPRLGATVIAVTDLGIRALPPPAAPASPDEWIALADYLDGFGCPLVALVPYRPERYPRRLRRRFAIIPWDRRTTAARVRAALARGLP